MRNYLLCMILSLSACAVGPTSVATQAATGCVSDPLTGGGDDDAVAHCPPPNSQQLAAATLSSAQQYAADNQIPNPTYDVSGGCGANGHGGITCVVVIRFGDNLHVVWACNGPDDTHDQPSCVVVDHG